MVNVCLSGLLKVIIHFWPRAARIYAHLSGDTHIVHAILCAPSRPFDRVDDYPFLSPGGIMTTVGAWEIQQGGVVMGGVGSATIVAAEEEEAPGGQGEEAAAGAEEAEKAPGGQNECQVNEPR